MTNYTFILKLILWFLSINAISTSFLDQIYNKIESDGLIACEDFTDDLDNNSTPAIESAKIICQAAIDNYFMIDKTLYALTNECHFNEVVEARRLLSKPFDSESASTTLDLMTLKCIQGLFWNQIYASSGITILVELATISDFDQLSLLHKAKMLVIAIRLRSSYLIRNIFNKVPNIDHTVVNELITHTPNEFHLLNSFPGSIINNDELCASSFPVLVLSDIFDENYQLHMAQFFFNAGCSSQAALRAIGVYGKPHWIETLRRVGFDLKHEGWVGAVAAVASGHLHTFYALIKILDLNDVISFESIRMFFPESVQDDVFGHDIIHFHIHEAITLAAAVHNRIHIMNMWSLPARYGLKNINLFFAIHLGHLEMVKLMIENQPLKHAYLNTGTITYAVCNTVSTKVFLYALQNGFKYGRKCLHFKVRKGEVEFVKEIGNHGLSNDSLAQLLATAVQYFQVDIVEYIFTRDVVLIPDTYNVLSLVSHSIPSIQCAFILRGYRIQSEWTRELCDPQQDDGKRTIKDLMMTNV